jgi:hypothetical protein
MRIVDGFFFLTLISRGRSAQCCVGARGASLGQNRLNEWSCIGAPLEARRLGRCIVAHGRVPVRVNERRVDVRRLRLAGAPTIRRHGDLAVGGEGTSMLPLHIPFE